ncbi:hypothetical protein [Acinetobacter schindleri]|jgi:uncharacterized protein YbgA (DUF1722 family)|uniref:hypothetical protein n=1 Tax=Acinetobacter schindleri TaxID=108981 RepID=UPI0013B06F4B|nr:hypothetical protein [Acinetobacter schindleri]MEB5929000.1 hypothetical protein [Acinetobacter schindleri]QIC60375.1 hypothetical protein FSC12_02950 [Acinetobacter schindleri]WQI98745.1 hypothetical protein Q7C11_09670 [Acinetobacter schindleri]
MKALAVLSLTLLLTACMSHDAQKAEHILKLFHCKGIEPSQMQHNSVTQYYEHSLYSSKSKAEAYIEQYKNGEESFEIPLSEIVNHQYELYKSACQNLGGIPAKESS